MWDVSSVTNFGRAFDGCSKFNADLSRWDVSNAKYLSYMFQQTIHTGHGLENWNTAKTRMMDGIFYHATKFNGDLSKWDTSSNLALNWAFRYNYEFTGECLESWDVTKVTTLERAFEGSRSFNGNLKDWNVRSVGRIDLISTNTTQTNSQVPC